MGPLETWTGLLRVETSRWCSGSSKKFKQVEFIKLVAPTNSAAGGGHLHVVKWVHKHFPTESSPAAMDVGLEIVQSLEITQ